MNKADGLFEIVANLKCLEMMPVVKNFLEEEVNNK
jgi:hypothetical protein